MSHPSMAFGLPNLLIINPPINYHSNLATILGLSRYAVGSPSLPQMVVVRTLHTLLPISTILSPLQLGSILESARQSIVPCLPRHKIKHHLTCTLMVLHSCHVLFWQFHFIWVLGSPPTRHSLGTNLSHQPRHNVDTPAHPVQSIATPPLLTPPPRHRWALQATPFTQTQG